MNYMNLNDTNYPHCIEPGPMLITVFMLWDGI